MKRFSMVSLPAFCLMAFGLVMGPPQHVYAADHTDSPAATGEPTADILDLYAWMSSDAKKVNVALTMSAFATAKSAFGTSTQYAVHINRSEGYGKTATETQIICQFYAADKLECWANGHYVEGDPSFTNGLTSSSGKLRVFAGLRDDPFFRGHLRGKRVWRCAI
jgi:hypothetical protein